MGGIEAAVELLPPDLGPHAPGNTGIPYVWSFEGPAPGPHVLLNALMHGNELCGAIALDRLLRAELRPRRGRLSLTFANVEAFAAFDPAHPVLSRYRDEDMNRVWAPGQLDGPRRSAELDRARALRPLFETADLLLDIHSMQHATPPLTLCGRSARGRALALRLGHPSWVVADQGHAAGLRLIDHPRFAGPGAATAILVECGQHWERASAEVALATALRFLLLAGSIDAGDAEALLPGGPPPPPMPPRLVEVTEAVTVRHDCFAFAADYRGMEIIPRAGTPIARDGDEPVLTPYDDCLLIMPSRRLARGHTAVRLGRIVA